MSETPRRQEPDDGNAQHNGSEPSWNQPSGSQPSAGQPSGNQPGGHHHGDAGQGAESVTAFWEERYSGPEHVWSGKPNHSFLQVVAGLTPGRSLDLGCGEGADVIWLAQNGWTATGFDISATAISRAQQAAIDQGVADRITFETQDLDAWAREPIPDDGGRGQYNLITASFLQSPVALDRIRILQRAARFLVRGGQLLIVSHAAPPSWAPEGMEEHADFPTPEQDLKALDPNPRFFKTLLTETRRHPATDPTGKPATMSDSVVLLQRVR